MSGAPYDAIVIGAGANGLVAAHYLARAGRRVLVVERRQASSPTLDLGWVAPRIVRDLDLEQHGLRIDQPDAWIAVALDGREQLSLSRDVAKSAEAIRRVSPKDAGKWPEFCERMHALAGVLERLYLSPAPDIETRDPRELGRLAALGLHVRRSGKQTIIDLARILPMAIAELLDDWFENDALKAALGAVGVWHLKQGPRSGGTAYNFLHHHVGAPAGVFRPSRSNLTHVLAGAPLPGIEVRRGVTARVTAGGVVLEPSGEELKAAVVVSSADPRSTFAGVKAELDPEFVRAVDNIKCRGIVATGTVKLERPSPSPATSHASSLDQLERAYDDAKYGRVSAQPYVEAHPTNGRLDLHVQYAAGEGTDLQGKVANVLGVDRGQVTLQTPADLQRDYGLTEGHLYHGELTLDQILFMRPVAGWSRYRTPFPGLYLCGAGTHPGGGIAGASGRNAARVILKQT